MPEPGLVEIFTGPGKGKTTAATGLAVRALGQGLRVLLVRFLKPEEPVSGEIAVLERLPGMTIITAGVGVLGRKEAPATVKASVLAAFAQGRELILAGQIDLAVFDEINNVLHHGYLPVAEVLALINRRPAFVELVLTGRNAPPELLARADLVTRMESDRHPYQHGIPARRGIEY